MTTETKRCGFVVLRVRLGVAPEFSLGADPGVNTLESKVKFSCQSNDGTLPAVFAQVLNKLRAAITNGDTRVELEVDGTQIVG
jgi:hypothetical protein